MPQKILIVLFSLLITLTCHSAAAAVLKIATVSPDGTAWMKAMRDGAAEIEQKTGGRVVLKFYPGGVMGNDEIVLRKMRIGQLHGGAITSGSLDAIYPDINIYGLPYLFSTHEQVDRVRATLDETIMASLEDKGFISFGFAGGGFTYMMSDSKLLTVDDVKDKKVWIPTGNVVGELVFKLAGISPVSLPLSDVMTGLQTGLIDTVITSPIGALALQWHTRIKYVIDVPLTYYSGILILSKRAFDRIKPADQQVVRDVMGRVFTGIDRQNREDNNAARTALVNQGIEFIKLESDVLEKWYEVGRRAMHELEQQHEYTPAVYRTLMDTLKARD